MEEYGKLARIVIEYKGFHAVLEGHGAGSSETSFWRCDDPNIKRSLDLMTYSCMRDGLIRRPYWAIIDNWAIEAGRVVAAKMGAKIISEEPYKIFKPMPEIDEETGQRYVV